MATELLADERYKAFIENIEDGVYEVDLHGNFTYFNDALVHVFGFPKEEIQGQHFSKFMDPDRASAAFDMFKQDLHNWKRVQRPCLGRRSISTEESARLNYRRI